MMRAQTANDPSPKRRSPSDGLAPVRVRLLGGFGVWVGPRAVGEGAWRLRKAKSLIKLLSLAPAHALQREQLMDLLWPELGKTAATNNLRVSLHAARRALTPDPVAASRYLASEEERIALCPEIELWVDAEAFEEAAAAARRSRDPLAYRAALELYGGELLPEDRYEEWAEERRQELRRTYLALLVELAAIHEERLDHDAAAEALGKVVAEEPSNEEAHARLMRLYALCGRSQEALRQYERLSEALSAQLGAQPNASTRALRQEIAAGSFPPEDRPQFAGPLTEEPAGVGKHNLPAARSGFVGRERELLEVKRALAMTRILTLIGTGGAGKTRLALEVARDLVGAYPDGVWLVELAPLSEEKLVPHVVAETLGVPEQPGRSLTDALVEALREKKVLVVLDNCEHLIGAAARLVDNLLGLCPRLRIVATSREALRVEGEILWRVPPLSVPEADRSPTAPGELARYEAVRLLVERARLRTPDFELRAENAGAVARICRRLEGIPLAIELAAARVGTLSVEQISERLGDSLGLLTAGSRTAAPRQQTLRGALDWSHGLLPESEQKLFRRLSVFAGGWTLGAAEVVGSGDDIRRGALLDLLSGLVDKSLVVSESTGEGGVRYRLLEPVRQYALEKLEESGDAEAVRGRHAAFFLALAEEAEPELRGPDQREWLGRLETEHDNLRAALSWALEQGEAELGLRLGGALSRFWGRWGHWSEGRRWLEEMLARSGAASVPVRAKALDGAGSLAEFQGDYERARAEYEETLALYRESRDSMGVATTLGSLGWLALAPNDYERATGLLEESLACFRALANTRGVGPKMGQTLVGLGHIALSVGDYERALKLYEEALALYRKSEDSVSIAMLQGSLGWLVMVQGDNERATEIFEESLAHFREVGLPTDANVLINLGLAVLGRGERHRAAQLMKEGLARAREFGDKQGIAVSLEGMAAVIAITQEKVERAAKLGGAAEALREAIGASLSVDERAMYEPYLDAARAKLGEAAWQAALAEGRAMTLEEAVEYALSEEQSAVPMSSTPERPSADELLALTRREEEVAALVARGLTNRQIASELVLSEHTVENHVARILKKLKVRSREQVVGVLMAQRRSHSL